jgi:hypothetical protein
MGIGAATSSTPRYAEVRALEVATITRDHSERDSGSWAPPTTGIQVMHASHQWLGGCCSSSDSGNSGGGSFGPIREEHVPGGGNELSAMEVLQGSDAALTLDKLGRLRIW